VAAIQTERVFERIQPFARGLVAAIHDPAVGLEQHSGAKKAVAVPPVGRASRRAAEAENTSGGAVAVRSVQFIRVLLRLQALAVGRGRVGLQPRLDGRVLGVNMVQVGHEVLYDRHMRQRRDLYVPLAVVNRLRTGQRVAAVDIHGAGAADPLPAGAAQGEGRVDFVLYIQQRVQNHRAAFVEVDGDFVHPGVLRLPLFVQIIGVPAVNTEGFAAFCAVGSVDTLALTDHGILGEGQFSHGRVAQKVRFSSLKPRPIAGKSEAP